jgi:hypothetical protein
MSQLMCFATTCHYTIPCCQASEKHPQTSFQCLWKCCLRQKHPWTMGENDSLWQENQSSMKCLIQAIWSQMLLLKCWNVLMPLFVKSMHHNLVSGALSFNQKWHCQWFLWLWCQHKKQSTLMPTSGSWQNSKSVSNESDLTKIQQKPCFSMTMHGRTQVRGLGKPS